MDGNVLEFNQKELECLYVDNKDKKYVLGIDPAIAVSGIAVIDSNNKDVVYAKKFTTNKKESENVRIYKFVQSVREVVNKFDISICYLEDQFFSRNVKTAMKLSRLRGALEFALTDMNVEIDISTPSVIRKNLLDDGSASKEEVASYIQSLYKNNDIVSNLGEFNDKSNKNKNSDIYDAISIGIAKL